MSTKEHWNKAYSSKPHEGLSWYQAEPALSLGLIAECLIEPDAAIVDIGGGASHLVDGLLDRGYRNITVLDISDEAIRQAKQRLGAKAATIQWCAENVTDFDPGHLVDVWHDRAVLHFLTSNADRAKYRKALERTVSPCGNGVIATFALGGPKKCSGLPVVRYGPEEMRTLLGSQFRLLTTHCETHTTPGGVEQKFMYFRFERVGV
jgi:2-polyprenyl-3-methyl-5-hydroxy-6-metoxy-1,4-benzoquinol methylase